MLAKTGVLRGRKALGARRSRLGARLARPQSIIVYIETETQPVPHSDAEIEHSFPNRRNRFNGSINQFSSFEDRLSILRVTNSGLFLTRISPLISSDSLSLFRK